MFGIYTSGLLNAMEKFDSLADAMIYLSKLSKTHNCHLISELTGEILMMYENSDLALVSDAIKFTL